MYTGIVQGLEKILDVRQGDGFSTLVVSNTHNFFHDVFIGAECSHQWHLLNCNAHRSDRQSSPF